MWKFLRIWRRIRDGQADRANGAGPALAPISSAELASLLIRARNSPIVFDLRDSAEIEADPRAIRGALFAFHVNLEALVPWVPPDSTVVVYAASDVPTRYTFLQLLSPDSRIYALQGGLQAWREAGLPMEHVVLTDRRSVDNG